LLKNRSISSIRAKTKKDPTRFNDLWREHYTKFPAFELPRGSVVTGGASRLDEFCKTLVADFDTEYLEPERLFCK